MKKVILLTCVILFSACTQTTVSVPTTETNQQDAVIGTTPINELQIEYARKQNYPGSDITVEKKLPDGSNYTRAVVSYFSQGNKIYALMTVPKGTKPVGGWPAIIFNHGYIPPAQYKTTEKYVAYQDAFARAGYITFKSDYRGHGDSEGIPEGAYGSPAYTTDVLNALESVKKYADTNPDKIGMWGHSMGGYITLRSMVISKDVKVGVIWGGVVGSYQDMLENWRRRTSPPPLPSGTRRWREVLAEMFGSPEANPDFWNSISANAYLADVSGPIQLHHSVTDEEVPVEFSQKLAEQLKAQGKTVELFTYPGDDHNISKNLRTALNRSVAFFDTYLK